MQPEKDSRPSSLSTQHLMQINQLCNDFEAHCQSGTIPRIEAWLKGISSEIYPVALRELLILEMEYRQPTGDSVTLAELKSRFPIVETSVLQQLIVNPNLESSNVDILRSTPTPLVTNGETEEIPEVLGDYRLIERIGGGGMGDVYKAVHQRMRRFVAIKVLRSEIKSDSQFNRRFEREVRAAARLTHPNIVAALDAREDNGVHYLVTEFVDGCDLDKAVKQSGPFPCDIAMDYILQAARGLEYAHRQGIVHRDIKPANLLRDNTGVVKLLDMGLARFRSNEEPDDADLTKSGMIMGTAAYMAPEQARNTRNADSKSDIYSLGCTLYFLMTGRPIYSAESVVDAILSHASQPAPRLHQPGIEIPVELEEVFQRMVAKDPSDRFQSMQEVIERLERLSTSNVAQKTASSNRMKKDGVTSNTHLRDVNATEIAGTSEGESNTGQQWRLTRILVSFIMGVVLLGIALSFSTVLFRPTDPIRVSNETVLEFDGRSSYGVVSSLEPMKGESYTLEAIVEPYEFRTSNVISWLGPDWMAIFLTNDGHWGVARRWQGRSYVQVAGLSSQLNKKVHLAGVFLGSDLRLYIDGKLTETESIEFQLSETTGGLFIGGTDLLNLQDERFFRGTIDSISITRGVRYREVFDPPNTLKPDGDSIAVFQFTKPQGKQNRSLDGKWIVELVNTKWNRRK